MDELVRDGARVMLAAALQAEVATAAGAGLSAATITRMTGQWQDEATAFNRRSLAGAGSDGTKELVALADGFRESSESWADLLRSCTSWHDPSGARRPRRGTGVLEGGP